MSVPVDVLAVMARDAADAFSQRRDDEEIQAFLHRESMEARAAVADLIEALKPIENMLVLRDSGVIGDEELACVCGSTVNRIRSALARVKGGAA